MQENLDLLLVNGVTENCGVCQYGKRLSRVLLGDPRLGYIEVSSPQEFEAVKVRPKILLFNYIACGRPSGPLGWLSQNFLDSLRRQGHIVGTIGHLYDVRFDFDFVLSQDPTCREYGNHYSLPRPLALKGQDDFGDIKRPQVHGSNKVTVGSFGFAAHSKRFPEVVRLVAQQIPNAKVMLNITNANYHDYKGDMRDAVIKECIEVPRPASVELVITSTFMSDDNVLKFLAGNDINIFAYETDGDDDGGVASVMDYAIACERPFAISRSSMFKHVNTPEVCFEMTPLNSIIDSGSSITRYYKALWSAENLKIKFWAVINAVNRIR